MLRPRWTPGRNDGRRAASDGYLRGDTARHWVDFCYLICLCFCCPDRAVETYHLGGRSLRAQGKVNLPACRINSRNGIARVIGHPSRVIPGVRDVTWSLSFPAACRYKGWPVRERIELPHLIPRTGHRVYHTTGFDHEEIIDLCIRINSAGQGTGATKWPPCLGLFR